MREVNGILPSRFGCYRILLRQDQSHDLAQSDILKKELNMDAVWWIFRRLVQFVFDEVVFGDHLDVGVVSIDMHRAP